MDISQADSGKVYLAIANAFNENRGRTEEELASFIEDKTNLFAAPISILYDISAYRNVTGNQASNLVICILQMVIPIYKKLIIQEQQDKINELEREIDRLSNIILNQWDLEDDPKTR